MISTMQIFSIMNVFHKRILAPHTFPIFSLGGTLRVRLLFQESWRSDLLPADNFKHFNKKLPKVLISEFFFKNKQGHSFKTSRNMSRKVMSATSKTLNSSDFRLDDYDCVGFDLDNTLCEYNISNSTELEYNVLANFLVKERGYDPDYLLKPLDGDSVDFLQKGLFLDFTRGNLLKIAENGLIIRASHGTKFMSDNEILDVYGKDRKWEVTTEFSGNVLLGWNGPLSERVRAFLDYFDLPASLAFARIVDSLDQRLGKPADIYNVWPDILDGFQHKMYDRENFMSGKDGFFKELKSNPEKFINVCNPDVVEWLKQIKRSKLTFLITGSNCDFASLTAEIGLGKNWRSLFDIIVCYARKPGFFTGCRPFIELSGFKETDPVSGSIELGKMYNQGNWQELYQLFAKALGKENPKCLYFGDHLIQDVFTPSEYTKCDTVAVVEELCVKGNGAQHGEVLAHQSLPILTSKYWGSFFQDEKTSMDTLWGSVIHKHAKICVPSISALAQYPISHKFKSQGGDKKQLYSVEQDYK